jgi:hypothetical protein
MRAYEGKGAADVTAMFRIAYDVAIRRCDICERCGKAPVSKALRIKDSVYGAFDTPSNLLAERARRRKNSERLATASRFVSSHSGPRVHIAA